jgi:NAD(P)-dependent dehydrogenase (short-subunit alcohol dehydrogenase family)
MSGVVITGGTRGIGPAVAVRLAKGGRPVAVTFAANSSAADALAEQIQRQRARRRWRKPPIAT